MARFTAEYTITVTHDSGRAIVYSAYSYNDVETKARELVKRPGVVRVEVRRQESFHYKTYFAV